MQLVFATGFLVPQRLLGHDYFRDVKARYPDAFFPHVPATGSIAVRAEILAQQIDSHFPSGPIHLIAHSMGGLDSRHALRQNLHGLANPGRVAVLSTIASPHHGTAVADLVVGSAPNLLDPRHLVYELVKDAAKRLGMPAGAIGDLTTGQAAKFNANCPNVPHIRYLCYAGSGTESFLLRPNHLYLKSIGQTPSEQANDGLVTAASASWVPLTEDPWPTDHIGEVGHNLDAPPGFISSFDHLSAFDRIIHSGRVAAGA